MKKPVLSAAALLLLSTLHLVGCPTCVGRIEQESPPFFSDEFYQKSTDSTLAHAYEQLLRDQQQEIVKTITKQQAEEKP